VVRIGAIDPSARGELADLGAALASLSHPDLGSYLDFGQIGTTEWFEASDVSGIAGFPARVRAASFLCSLGLSSVRIIDCHPGRGFAASLLGADGCPADVAGALSASGPNLGIRLLERPLVTRLVDRLDAVAGTGPVVWNLRAQPGAGWRSAWRVLAREARRRGVVPVASDLLGAPVRLEDGTQPWLGRLCDHSLLVACETLRWDADAASRLSALLIAIGSASARMRIVLNVVREGSPPGLIEVLTPVTARQICRLLQIPVSRGFSRERPSMKDVAVAHGRAGHCDARRLDSRDGVTPHARRYGLHWPPHVPAAAVCSRRSARGNRPRTVPRTITSVRHPCTCWSRSRQHGSMMHGLLAPRHC
jgi:hypothetical protein